MPMDSIPMLLAAGLLLGLAGLFWRSRLRRRGAFLAIATLWRAYLRRQGFTETRHFFGLAASVVSGHPGRDVARTVLSDGDLSINAFLKREYRVSWKERMACWAAGFGFRSRSLREARLLEVLSREGIGCPEWLAAGEDGHGRAFLLVRAAPGMTDLRVWLTREMDHAARLRLARSLGAALARMHSAGFSHPDLYSKHVLVGADGETVQFLDWQRTRRQFAVNMRRRARDFAALHATLAESLAGPRERLACLRAYMSKTAMTGPKERRGFLRLILRRAHWLRGRRHVREKRQPALAAGLQEWKSLDGDALCVTPALAAAWPDRLAKWLAMDRQPPAPEQMFLRRWLIPSNGSPALFVRRRRRRTLGDLWRGLGGRPPIETEQRQAELLLRLQRHGVEAPSVLAMGRRTAGDCVESFVLTQPAEGAVRLTAWLARRPLPALCRRALAEAGALLRRLHDAACCLDKRDPSGALAVRQAPEGQPTVLLVETEFVQPLRGIKAARARRDVAAVERILAGIGCSPADLRRFLAGYDHPALGDATSASPPPLRPSYWTADGPSSQGGREMSVSLPATADSPTAAAPPTPTDSLWTRLWRGACRSRQQPDWPRFAGPDWAERVMDATVTDRFHAKQGRTTGRLVLQADGAEPRTLVVYLKRHSSATWWDRLGALVRPGRVSPAFKEWDHLEWAGSVGIPVPRSVAAAEYIGPGPALRSFLAVEELHDMLPLNEAVPLAASQLAPAEFRAWKRGLIAEAARLTRLLHDRRRFHKDLYLCHFFIRREDIAPPPALPRPGGEGCENGWRGRVFLIDLHRLGRHPWTWFWWRMKDLAQLLYSTEIPGIVARDRLDFWRAYRGPGPRRLSDRWLVRLVLFKWRRYRRHNTRQKAREALKNGVRNQSNAPAGGGESS